MRRTKYLKPLILAASQTITFIVVYSVAWELARLLASPKRDISWGITVELAVWIFGIISFVGAVIGQFIFKERRLAVQCASLLVFTALFINLIDDRPYRLLLLLFCGLIGFLVPFLLLRNSLQHS